MVSVHIFFSAGPSSSLAGIRIIFWRFCKICSSHFLIQAIQSHWLRHSKNVITNANSLRISKCYHLILKLGLKCRILVNLLIAKSSLSRCEIHLFDTGYWATFYQCHRSMIHYFGKCIMANDVWRMHLMFMVLPNILTCWSNRVESLLFH